MAPIVLDVRVFAFAEMKLLEPLKELAAAEFTQRAEAGWKTDDFAAALHEVYTIVPEHEDTLRQIVVRVVKEHAKDLFGKPNDYAKFRQAVRDQEGFGDDVSEALAIGKNPKSSCNTYTCPGCSGVFSVSIEGFSTFGCPKGCYSQQAISWWKKYEKK